MAYIRRRRFSKTKGHLRIDEERLETLRQELEKMIVDNGIITTNENSVEDVVRQTNYNRLVLLKKTS